MFSHLVFRLGAGLLFLTISLSTLKIKPADDGHCIWYEICQNDSATNVTLACVYNGPPIQTNQDNLAILEEYCPILLDGSGSPPKLCCSNSQLQQMIAGLEIPKPLMQNCPACWSNYRDYVCSLSCSPSQSNFLKATQVIPADSDHPGQSAITEISFYITKDFADGFYNSCKNVKLGTTGTSILSKICGPWGAENCTPMRLFNYFGNISNGYTPIQMNFFFKNGPIDVNGIRMLPLDVPTTPCNKPVNKGTNACSCTDCPSACPTG